MTGNQFCVHGNLAECAECKEEGWGDPVGPMSPSFERRLSVSANKLLKLTAPKTVRLKWLFTREELECMLFAIHTAYAAIAADLEAGARTMKQKVTRDMVIESAVDCDRPWEFGLSQCYLRDGAAKDAKLAERRAIYDKYKTLSWRLKCRMARQAIYGYDNTEFLNKNAKP